MAEIHVQTKKRGAPLWIWLVIILLLLGAIAYVMVMRNNKTSKPNPTSFFQPGVQQGIQYL